MDKRIRIDQSKARMLPPHQRLDDTDIWLRERFRGPAIASIVMLVVVLLAVTGLLLHFAFTEAHISRREASIFLVLYFAYLVLVAGRAI